MPEIRKLDWKVEEYTANPEDYDYESDTKILEIEQKNYPDSIITLIEDARQFTFEQIKQLVAARGFLETVCARLESDSIQNKFIRVRVALIQHLLNDIWTKLDGQ